MFALWRRPETPPARPSAPAVVHLRGEALPLRLRPSRRARRFVVRLDSDRIVRLTLPERARIDDATRFLLDSVPWLERRLVELDRTAPPKRWPEGTTILFRGRLCSLDRELFGIALGELHLPIPPGVADLRPRVERALRTLAEHELPPRVEALARAHACRVTRVSVRNQRSRWGSCNVAGVICLNWRLVQTPDFVRDYIILHELMHLRHMDHSDAFWREVAAVCPRWEEAETWLRLNAARVGL